jgi:hypothetical protein
MGYLDKAKEAIGIGKGDATDELAGDVIDEVEEDDEEQEGEEFDGFGDDMVEDEDIQEQEPNVWDDAYDFAMDHLDEEFTDGGEFAVKVMARDIDRSDIFRDRISVGVNTISSITDAVGDLKELQQGGDTTDWTEKAEKLDAADDVINTVDSLSGKEDEMVNNAMTLLNKGVETFAKSSNIGGGSEVDTDTRDIDGEI